jgi:hypothetical protein
MLRRYGIIYGKQRSKRVNFIRSAEIPGLVETGKPGEVENPSGAAT